MAMELSLTLVLALIPVILGSLGRISRLTFSALRPIGLTVIILVGGALVYGSAYLGAARSGTLLAAPVLLSAFCTLLGQRHTKVSLTVFASIMIVLGLTLGVLLNYAPTNRLFLIGVLGYIAISLVNAKPNTLQAKLILIQVVFAVILSFASLFIENRFSTLAGLVLAVTLLPLAPFHLPFVSIVHSAQGTLSSFWVVVLLALGLAELHALRTSITGGVLSVVQMMALGSALYASLKCLGQNQIRVTIAYATVAHVALLWGLTNVFFNFSQWAMPFGTAVALVMSGLLLVFSYVQHRYGPHLLGTLPGLASPMPLFGNFLIILISLAMLLPILPASLGLVNMPTIEKSDESLLLISLTFLTVWLLGSWYLSRLLHQTAFGKTRTQVPYTDLKRGEIFTLALLVLGASFSVFV